MDKMTNTTAPITLEDNECICHGNWRQLVKECTPLFGRQYIDNKGEIFYFVGLVWAEDDLYFEMYSKKTKRTVWLTCVGSIENQGYTLLPDQGDKA
jgi:hypothetical protein